MKNVLEFCTYVHYSGSLWAGQCGDRTPVVPDFLQQSRPALEPTQPPIQWIPGIFSRGKAAGAWS